MNQDKTTLQNHTAGFLKVCVCVCRGGAETRCVIAIKESLGLNYTDPGCLPHLNAVGQRQRRPLEPKFRPI